MDLIGPQKGEAVGIGATSKLPFGFAQLEARMRETAITQQEGRYSEIIHLVREDTAR